MYINYLNPETNITIDYDDETYKKTSLTSELCKIKKKHIKLNNLIHIYSHKAQYTIDRIKKKSNSTHFNTQNFTVTEPSGLFLTTNANKLTIPKNIKYNNLTIINKKKNGSPQSLNTFNKSLDNKKFPTINNMFVVKPNKEKPDILQMLRDVKENVYKKKSQDAKKHRDKNNLLKQNVLMNKTKVL